MILAWLQGHSSVRQVWLKILSSYLKKFILCRIVKYIKQVMNIPLFLTDAHVYLKEIIEALNFFFFLTKPLFVGFFTDTVQARFSKLLVIIPLLGVYQFIPGLVTLTLLQGHRCVRIINCSFFSLKKKKSFVHHSLYKCCMVLTLKRSGTVCFVWIMCI